MNATTGMEARRTTRQQPKPGTEVSCRRGAMGLGPEVAVRLLDVSEAGAMLVVPEALPLGVEIELAIMPPGQSRPLVRTGTVVRCQPLAGEGFAAGVEFQSYLSYGDLFQLT
jgi:hypothetical protein